MKKKKGKNVYEIKVTLGRDENGMPIRKSITGRTKPELKERIDQAKENFKKIYGRNDSVLFGTFARRWLATAKAVKSLNTRNMYENAIEKHIIPEIGDQYFDEITLSDLQKIINDRAEKYETCNKIRLTLRQIFTAAIDEGIKTEVKASKLVLPPKKKNEKRALTRDEKTAIFKCETFTPEQKAFVQMLFYTGIRKEEALALDVNDLDFKSRSVSIKRTLIFDKNDPVIKEGAKSSAGVRSVPLPADSIEMLTEYAASCDRILFPMPSNPQAYMTHSSYVKFWNGIITKLSAIAPSAESLTAHIFRHNYATMLYYSEVSTKMAAKLMGHSGIQMIMQVYAHLDDEKENVNQKLDAIIKKD